MSPAGGRGEDAGRPVLRVVRGNATAEEVAALVAVLAAAAANAAASAPAAGERTGTSAWNDRAAILRAGVTPGPGAWRSSALPR